MTRRSLLTVLLGAYTAACNELRRDHSSVSFELSTNAPSAGQPFTVTFNYLDDAEPGTYVMVLMRTENREEVDQSPVADARTRVTLTPPSAGEYTIEFRRRGQMIAHRRVSVR